MYFCFLLQIVLKGAKISVFLIVFKGVIYHVYLYCYRFWHELGTRKDLLGPRLNNTAVYLTPLLVIKITRLHDN